MDKLMRPGAWTVAFILVACLSVLAPVLAQDAKLKKEELDQLLAPIALYPDDLLTNVLMASTYPLDVVQAARWRKEQANVKLKGDALVTALEPKDWDPSIKALAQFPDVLETMSDKLDWTQKLGDAFLAQQDEVMDEIQFLRQKAEVAGNLNSNKQQKVSTEAGAAGQEVIVIESASPETIYVPVYEPTVVYGPWWYPDYPPYYWPYPSAAFVNGFFWGTGIAIAGSIWGWNHFDWRRHDIDIDVNKWNNINVNRSKITSGKWEHNPSHRGPVPYKNKEVREKYGKTERAREVSKDFRGFDTGLDKSKIGGAAPKLQDKGRDLSKAREAPQAKQKVSERPQARSANPSPEAFDVKRGAEVRRDASRGQASRTAMNAGRSGQRGSGARGAGGHRGGRR
jgi:hypothetical protein